MINKKSLALILFVVAYSSFANAQSSVIPAFKKLVLVDYKTTQPTAKNIDIKDLVEINETGRVHFRSVYYNGIADTTYQLTDAVIVDLNKIFNGKRKLQSYMVTNKLQPGEHLGGGPEFISYTDSKNKTDNFIYISTFMDASFNKLMQKLVTLPSKASSKDKSIKNVSLEALIIKFNNTCNYMPVFEDPPSEMQ